MPRIAVAQMTSGIDPDANASEITEYIRRASDAGSAMLFTPEMCALIDRDRKRASANIVPESRNSVILAACAAARQHGIWVALGSVPVLAEDGRYANRTIIIDHGGAIAARYDKIHMFDVDLDSGESWRESNAYRAGDAVVAVDTPVGRLGLTICYDLRFPALFEELGQLACDMIAIPAAFTVPTGRDHWHVLQRARAIEASAFVVAAAQTGIHEDGRLTYGHSLVVDPWGTVLLDMGEEPGLKFADVDLNRIAEVRKQLPSLANRRKMPKGCVP